MHTISKGEYDKNQFPHILKFPLERAQPLIELRQIWDYLLPLSNRSIYFLIKINIVFNLNFSIILTYNQALNQKLSDIPERSENIANY